ncbi:transcription factor bHLH041 [Canna indica]|uniref:Transcription factor bHLH041 n=1 Tax=Canna indica TaxID=4628 RepID=A0AAQ3KGB4_9LILI|nr:transcription factor bHLH041 [Canna indica]
MNVQRQFYQEAGIKAAVFVGCRSGEIELGMMMPPNMNMQTSIQQVFSEDYLVQHYSQLRDQSLLEYPRSGEQLIAAPDKSRLSSSSSSLRSLSVGSPDTSPRPLHANKASASFVPDEIAEQALLSPHHINIYDQFPASMCSPDEAMTRAMLAVISSMPSSSPPPPLMYQKVLQQQQQQHQKYQRHGRIGERAGAFRAYNALMLAPKLEAELSLPGQRMIKTGINFLRRISLMKMEAQMQEQYRPTSNQLHHMISERRRREKLNENFQALRLLLPPGSKKDKASVLANTKNYLNSLKAQIKELEERNQTLEMQLQAADDEATDDSNERVQVQVSRAAASTSEAQEINLKLIVREECEMIDLVFRVLGCLKEMRDVVTLVSMEASTRSPPSNAVGRANLRMQIKDGEWDEESFKEAVTKAVNYVLEEGGTASPS